MVSNGFREDCERKVNQSNLTAYVETIISAEDFNHLKPDPKIFELALKITKASKENSFFIGDDWVADVLGATNFGLKTFFLNTLQEKHQLEGVIVIDNLMELVDILNE